MPTTTITASSKQQTHEIRLVCISDTHNHSPGQGYTLPQGDILIHAGDLTNEGTYQELEKAAAWIAKADFRAKVVIAGNHDIGLDTAAASDREDMRAREVCRALFTSIPQCTYLEHSSAIIQSSEWGAEEEEADSEVVKLRIFGSPFSPAPPNAPARRHHNAFQYTLHSLSDLWDSIPSTTDILVTHTPPVSHCDASTHWQRGGCESLLSTLGRVKPLLHVCGHCHEGRGAQILSWDEDGDVAGVREWRDPSAGKGSRKQSLLDLRSLVPGEETAVVNASIMARSFGRGAKAFNKPVVVDFELPAISRSVEDKDPLDRPLVDDP